MNLNENYSRDDFFDFLNSFIPNFKKDIKRTDVRGLKVTKEAFYLGESEELDLAIFELTHNSSTDARVTLAMDGFRLMKDSASYRALVIYTAKKGSDWRLSLMTASPDVNQKGKVGLTLSNPRRFSFFLGPNAKINTPYQYLIKQTGVKDFEDLLKRFSVEVVNKEFYKEIAELYTKLVGGTRGKGNQKKEYKALLTLPSVEQGSQTANEFAVRLIGRIIFCWFLREKKSKKGLALISDTVLSLESLRIKPDYYHTVLEPLFFEVLNKLKNSRKDDYRDDLFGQIPYLNGGLFSPQDDDYYSSDSDKQAINQNTVKVPDSWLNELFEVLELYNFTVDENTSIDIDLSIDPEMLGRIFENLLAEINPETGESARKSTGSYYTPRPIVEYMVDESLCQYLKEKTGIDELKIRSLISYDLIDDEAYPLNKGDEEKVIQALSSIRILDPACGSGAFPIGALQKIIFMLQRIDPNAQLWFGRQIENASPEIRRVMEREFAHKNFDYIRKLGIIRESIFGVDIQPIATEIARLRCFLTLIVDERADDDEPNRGVEPLPNLDFKFVTANTLIGLPSNQTHNQIGLFEDQEGIKQLKEVRDAYFNASGVEREQLKLKFVQIQNKMFQRMIQEHTPAELTQKLSSWDPFGHDAATWFDMDWMFGIKEGFDIVIANPPYLGEKGHKEIFQELAATNLGKFYQRRMDLFYFFYHLALNVSKPISQIAYITTNYFPTADGAKKLRKDFKERAIIRKLINFNELRIFESAQGQHNMVSILSKGNDKNAISQACITTRTGIATAEILQNIINFSDKETNFSKILQEDLYEGDGYYIRAFGNKRLGNYDNDQILQKIQNVGSTLKNFCRVESGIQTSLDKISQKHIQKYPKLKLNKGEGVFVLSEAEKDILETPENKHYFCKWYKNSDIKKYHSVLKKINQEYLVYVKDEGKSITLDKKLSNHFSNFKEILIDIKENCFKNQWLKNIVEPWIKRGNYFVLFYPREKSIFLNEKIVVPYRSKSNNFAYNDEEWFASIDVTFITVKNEASNLKYVLSILNSKLIAYWLWFKGKRKGNILELYPRPVSEIPIKEIKQEDQKPFIKIVDKILAITKSDDYLSNEEKQLKVDEYKKQIDDLVYKLYGLTPQEIVVVENQSGK